jgi:hypothetical protein
LDSVPKRMRGKAELLLKKMKSNRDITWNEKGELKYKDKIVHGSNIVDLVNDVLRPITGEGNYIVIGRLHSGN